MKLRRIISAVLAVVMLGTTAMVAASAEEVPEKTYNYVALGDSIASGYGLDGGGATDKALILSEDLIADPQMEAYAQVFGQMLAELGAEKGYTTTATNLAATAYRAEDIEKLIFTPGYKGEVAEWIFENFVGEGSGDVLLAYYDIYQKYLPEADMISIGLGGNDVIMGMVYPMIKSGNPILTAIAVSTALVLFGQSVEIALGGGLQYLSKAKDSITAEQIAEVPKFFAEVLKNKDIYVVNAANNVSSVVDAVRTVNGDADIALINMYNPYGNSLEYEGQVRDISAIISNIFAKAIDEAVDINIEVGDVTITPSQGEEETVERLEDIAIEIKDITVDRSYFDEMRKERAKALLTMAASELAYPLQYLLVGKNIDPQIKLLDELLLKVADEKGATYVDVYDISNECNLDPHPLASGHREIAERMYATLSESIAAKMDAGEEEQKECEIGDANGDGKIDISDVTVIQKHLAEEEILTGNQLLAADTNGDGKVDIEDVTLLQQYIAGYDVVLGNVA